MYALVSHSDGSSGDPDGMLQPARGPKAEDKDKEVAFVFTDIESSTELSNQDGDAFKQVGQPNRSWRCLELAVALNASVSS
jgi:class 3 adenylate cyclase